MNGEGEKPLGIGHRLSLYGIGDHALVLSYCVLSHPSSEEETKDRARKIARGS
jgi:hypothetical protein